MLIVKNMLGQETLYSTHSPKNGYYSQFEVNRFIVNRFFEQNFF